MQFNLLNLKLMNNGSLARNDEPLLDNLDFL